MASWPKREIRTPPEHVGPTLVPRIEVAIQSVGPSLPRGLHRRLLTGSLTSPRWSVFRFWECRHLACALDVPNRGLFLLARARRRLLIGRAERGLVLGFV